jgi:hypothetical protein
MIEFHQLVNLIDTKIKNNIKDGDYLKLMYLVSKIYKIIEEGKESEQEEECDYGGQYI